MMLNFSSVLVGLSCGICTPGYSFMNWIDEKTRPTLSMIINIFNGAGGLTGPIIGSYLVSLFKTNKVFKAWGIVAFFVNFVTFYFLMSFKDFDDNLLIAKKEDVGSVLKGKELGSISVDVTQDEHNNDEEKVSEVLDVETQGGEELDDDIVGEEDIEGENTEQAQPAMPVGIPDRLNTSVAVSRIGHNVTLAQAIKINEVMNETKLGFKGVERPKGPLEIFKSSVMVRDLIFGQSIFWAIKVLDWLLIPIWAGIPKDKSGLGFTNIMVGEITFYSFPGVFFFMVIGYGTLKGIRQVEWLIISSKVFFVVVGLTPIVGLFNFSDSFTLWWLVSCECLKVSSYLIYSSAWSVLMNGLIDSSVLGRMYSFSFCFSHLALIFLLQLYPRFMSFVLENKAWQSIFGRFSVMFVFLLMTTPNYLGIKYAKRVKKIVEDKNLEVV